MGVSLIPSREFQAAWERGLSSCASVQTVLERELIVTHGYGFGYDTPFHFAGGPRARGEMTLSDLKP